MVSTIQDLDKKLQDIPDEQSRIDYINEFAWYNQFALPKECLLLSQQMLKQSKQLNYAKGEAAANICYAYILWNEMGNLEEAKGYCDKAYHAALLLNEKDIEAECCMFYGFMNGSFGDFEKALEYLQRSMDIAVQFHFVMSQGWAGYGLGMFYLERKDPSHSLSNFEKGLAAFTAIEYKNGIVRCLTGIAGVHQLKKEFSEAIALLNEVLRLCSETNFRHVEARAYNDLGNIYLLLENFSEAEKFLLKSLQIKKETGNKSIISTTLLAVSELYLKTSSLQKALNAAQESLQYAEEIKVKPKIFQSHQRLAEIYKELNDPVKSLEHFEKFIVLKTEVMGEESNNRINQLQTKFATEKSEKEAEIFRLKNVELKEAYDKLKETQQQLIHSEKMSSLGQLTAGIAHEINNPINFVSANIHPLKRNLSELKDLMEEYEAIITKTSGKEVIENLKKKFEKDFTIAESENLLKGIEEGSKRTADIVKGLRNFSRLDEDDLKQADINEGIESTLVLVQNKLKEHDIEVEKLLGDIPAINCYPGRLNQVFMNLLTNAIDAIGNQGKIFIATSSENNYLKISIRDTGTGMSDEVKKKLFDPFFTTKDVGKGTGLGLSISYGIIEKHNGKIKVKSEEGKGTEFIITLPV